MDIRHTILWVVFSLMVVLLLDSWQRANGHQSVFFPMPQATATTAVVSGNTLVGGVPSNASTTAVVGSQAAPTTGATSQASASERIVISTDLLRTTTDTDDVIVTKLKSLDQEDHDGNPMVLFDCSVKHTCLACSDLIGDDFPNHVAVFAASPGPRDLDTSNDVSITLTTDKSGAEPAKTYALKCGSCVINSRFDMANNGIAPINPTLYLKLTYDGGAVGQSRLYGTFIGSTVCTNSNKFYKTTFADIDKGKTQVSALTDSGWAVVVRHYSTSVWTPAGSVEREYYVNRVDINFYRIGTQEPLGTVALGASVSITAHLFAGPQQTHILEAITPGLDLVKDYDWLIIVTKPLLQLLEKIRALLGNWGWSTVALTVLIKLVFFPLSAMSYRSMAKMKDLQPCMMIIHERHKDDPQKMDQEMMTLYRTGEVNPFDNCLPVVIQIPMFTVLYWTLLSLVKIRDASRIGWVHGLLTPDPFYILPVLMTVSTSMQTEPSPIPPDPVQAKVMIFMPIAFSMMPLFFLAGLVLYWVVNNCLSIAQQWSINRMSSINGKAAPVK